MNITVRDSNTNKTTGVISANDNKQPVEKMIAVDILTNDEVSDPHDSYYYVTS